MGDDTLLNLGRPPIFCPGCSHDKVLRVVDRTLVSMGVTGDRICVVTDIGCSGFFDVFFDTHAMHGVHGRALTYAAGIKLCRPELNVLVTMGDGGVGIGAAHIVSASRRNLDLTLLVMNNFNFGMTGGQASATTPNDATVASGFLNRLERPIDVASLAAASGAPFVCRCSAYQSDLGDIIRRGMEFEGFSLIEILGICPGRYTKRNRISPGTITAMLDEAGAHCGEIGSNVRPEFGRAYREQAAALSPVERPAGIVPRREPPDRVRREVVLLGAAGQRVNTAGEILALAGLSAGLWVSRKNEYDVTVLRGPSICELILSPNRIEYNGSTAPDAVIALAEEGVKRRWDMMARLGGGTLLIAVPGLDLPDTAAPVHVVDFKSMGLARSDWALASIAWLARMGRVLSPEMLEDAVHHRFEGNSLEAALDVLERVTISRDP
jgi:hypothetical protein